MTEPPELGFETLVYTDCLPGQGLRGTAGLQFQARSAGADREAMSIVQRTLLYEPPASWMRERRTVEEYPPSFAHVVDTVFATACGVYLGREANGGREGNQLTHSIVTRDPAAYRQVRPAQLFGAPFWTDRPAATTTCQPLTGHWEPGPVDAAAAQEFVFAQPAGTDMLRALLAAFECLTDPQPRRVLFIAEEPTAVILWITAATLLMPQVRAVRVGFEVFSTNPAYAPQPVVAVHPDWESTSARVGNDSGYSVFDLTRGEWTPVAVPPDVELRVRLFSGHEAIDVVDVIEMADLTTEPDPMKALALGQMLVLPDPQMSVEDARIAVRWLRDTPAELLAAHRGALVDQLTSKVEKWPRDVLANLDAVAVSGQLPVDRVAEVRLALIEKELDRALRRAEVSAGPLPRLPPGTWNAEDIAAGERLVLDALRQDPPLPVFDVLLRVAHRFALPVTIDEIPELADAFVADWAEHPDRPYDWSLWPCGPDLYRKVVRRLNELAAGGAADAVGDRWWPLTLNRLGSPDTPFGEALIAAAMVHAPPSTRVALVQRTMASAVGDLDPVAAVAAATRVLWRRRPPDIAELRDLSSLMPPGLALDPVLTGPLVATLADAPALSPALLETTRLLIRRGQLAAPPGVDKLMMRDSLLRRACEQLPTAHDENVVRDIAGTLRGVDERLIEVWRGPLIYAMFAMTSPPLLATLVAGLPRSVYKPFVLELLDRVATVAPVPEIVTAFYFSGGSEPIGVDPEVADQLRERVHRFLVRAPDRHLKPLLPRVERLGKPWVARWKDAREAARGGRRWWSRGRGGEG